MNIQDIDFWTPPDANLWWVCLLMYAIAVGFIGMGVNFLGSQFLNARGMGFFVIPIAIVTPIVLSIRYLWLAIVNHNVVGGLVAFPLPAFVALVVWALHSHGKHGSLSYRRGSIDITDIAQAVGIELSEGVPEPHALPEFIVTRYYGNNKEWSVRVFENTSEGYTDCDFVGTTKIGQLEAKKFRAILKQTITERNCAEI